jgi:prepilin-type processing-associated H-X9-DG protein
VTTKRLPIFMCASDTPNAPSGNITNNNYVVNFGNTNFFQANVSIAGGTILYGGAPFNAYPGSTSDDGPVDASQAATWTREYGKPVKLDEITSGDGTSNTLMLSEVRQGQGLDARGFSWWGGGTGFTTLYGPNSTSPDVMTGAWCNTADPRNAPCVTSGAAPPSELGRRQFARSRHQGGGNAAMCDGSVRYFRNTISVTTWRGLGTSRGQEVVDAGP